MSSSAWASLIAALQMYAIPVLVTLALVEGAVKYFIQKAPYNWKACAASTTDFLIREVVLFRLIPLSLAGPLIGWAWEHRLTTIQINNFAAFVLLFIGQEFTWYWYHRCAHRIRWFWATHSVHHSPEELNLSAAYRFGFTGRIAGNASLFYVPLVWVGFPPIALLAALLLNLLYQFWLHTDWTPKLGWLEYVLNTPSHHRVHHGCNPEYLDSNFGAVLIVFDRLFGTFVAEREDTPIRFGLVKPVKSHNPIVIAFHEWRRLLVDVWYAQTWYARFMYVLGPPGWSPLDAGRAAVSEHYTASLCTEPPRHSPTKSD